MASTTILSDNGVSSGSAGIKTTGGNDGVLALQTTTAGGTATTAVTIDTSQNVGIGTSSPSNLLHVSQASSDFQVRVTGTSAANAGAIRTYSAGGEASVFGTTGSSNAGYGASLGVLGTVTNIPQIFVTNNTERARIDTSGNLLVGSTSVLYYSHVLSTFNGASQYGFVSNETSGSSNAGFFACTINGVAIGSITRNGVSNAVLYNTTSDQRLKENIADADSALDKVGAIQVRKYDWKEGGQHEDHGFIAQELAEVVNNVVSQGRTEEDMWAVDYGKLTPLLVKAIQEQQALITTLTERITALEAK